MAADALGLLGAAPDARAVGERLQPADPLRECGSGSEVVPRVLTPRRTLPSSSRQVSSTVSLLPGLGEAPLRRLADGAWVVDGPSLDLREGRGSHALARRRAALASVVVGRDHGGATRLEPTGAGVLRAARASGETLGHGASHRTDDAGWTVAEPLDSVVGGGVTGFGGSGAPDVWFGYRATEFTVPADWLLRYRLDLVAQWSGDVHAGHGKVSGTDEVLDFLWPELRAAFRATGVSSSTWYDMLGCYNLPRETMPEDIGALFWHSGWGPPYRTYLFTNALVLAYAGLIQDLCSGVDACDGFGDFVAAVLRGEEVVDKLGNGPCPVRFRFMNDDTAHAFVGGSTQWWDAYTCGVRASLGATRYACDEGFLLSKGDAGEDWGKWLGDGRFNPTSNAWEIGGVRVLPSGSSTVMSEPSLSTDALAYVSDGSFAVTQRPVLLSWHGFVCDYVLYLARMAHDRGRDPGASLTRGERALLRRKSRLLGRYALRVLVRRGRVLIHELGHVFNGRGGHCTRGRCCFELAAQRWKCAVIAELGLPVDSGTPSASDTWVHRGYVDRRDHCVPKGSAEAAPLVSCYVPDPGTVGSTRVFACTGCGGDSYGWEVG